MKQITLTKDMHMPAYIDCGCAGCIDGNSLYTTAGIEWQEGILYIMCSHCGKVKLWEESSPEEE